MNILEMREAIKKYKELTAKVLLLIKIVDKSEHEMWELYDTMNELEILNSKIEK